ncbi:MAG: Lrp/AsnC family transcriptional regulator [Burkholderiaceae bacterium]|nr:MAG: Lrp/AsnC family transcriptional regulator [Burkholderiaceae bacterium]
MLTPALLDETDEALLALLRTHARASTAELARQLSLARTTVQSRIDRLERLKVIVGYTVVVPDELESKMIRAHVMITVAPKLSGAVEEALRRIPQVRQLHSVSGPFDLIALVAERSIGDLEQLLDRIGRLEGVERTTSAIVMSTKLTR